MNSNISLQKLNYNEQAKIINIIRNDALLKKTFGGTQNTISRILNSSYMGLILKDDITIGFIMLVYNAIDKTHELDIGITDEYRNHGYGTEALGIMKKIIVKEKAKITIQTKNENISATKIINKNNFMLIKQDKKHSYYS